MICILYKRHLPVTKLGERNHRYIFTGTPSRYVGPSLSLVPPAPVKTLKTRRTDASDRSILVGSDPERRTVSSLKNKVLSPSPEAASLIKCDRWDVFTGRYATGTSRTSPHGWVNGVPVKIYRWLHNPEFLAHENYYRQK